MTETPKEPRSIGPVNRVPPRKPRGPRTWRNHIQQPVTPRTVGPETPYRVRGKRQERKYPLIEKKAEEQRDDWMHETLP